MVARVFGLIAPFTSKLAVVWTSLPMLTLGIPSLVAAALALRLTETSKRKLPTTMDDAQNMVIQCMGFVVFLRGIFVVFFSELQTAKQN